MDFLEYIKVLLPYVFAMFLIVWFGPQVKRLLLRLSKVMSPKLELSFDKEQINYPASNDGKIYRYICKTCARNVPLNTTCKCGELSTKENVIDLLVYINAIHSINKIICPICGNGILGETAHICPSCGYGFGKKRYSTFALIRSEVGLFCGAYIFLGAVAATGLIGSFVESYFDVSLSDSFFGVLFIFFIFLTPLVFIAFSLSSESRRQSKIYKIVRKMGKHQDGGV